MAALLYTIAALLVVDDASGMQARGTVTDCVPAGMRRARVGYGPGAFDMVVLGNDDILSATVMRHHSWEVLDPQQIADVVGGVMPRNGTFLDIGANLGYYTLMFARRGYHVISVEPMTRNRKAIQSSLCLNPELRSLVTLLPVALVAPEDRTKGQCVVRSTNYSINVGNGYVACGKPPPCSHGDANCENCAPETLDALLAKVKPKSLDVVKIDVDNFECRVLQGGRSMFRDKPRFVQVQLDSPSVAQCVRQEMKMHGYSEGGRQPGPNNDLAVFEP